MAKMLFCPQIANLIFELIAVSSGEKRLSFVRLLANIVDRGVYVCVCVCMCVCVYVYVCVCV